MLTSGSGVDSLPVGLLIGVIAFSLLVGIFMLFVYGKIISRSGYSGWWVLAAFVPILNIVMVLMFAFKEWPVQRELRELRAWAEQTHRMNSGPGYPPSASGYPPGYPQG